MKARFVLFALAALAAQSSIAATGSYSIFFNDYNETTSSCHIDNVSSVQTSTMGSANLVAIAANPLAFVNCGTGSGTAPAVSLGISPASVNAGAVSPGNQSTLTWSANNVTSCTISGSDASVATEFPAQWANATVACGGNPNKCAGNPNTVTLAPIVNGADGNYTFGLQCTDGVTIVSTTKILAVTGSTVTGGTPTANFNFAPNGLTVSFTDTSTTTGSPSNLVYSWNFGDAQVSGGGTSTLKNPNYSYTVAGTYGVTEIVKDSVSNAQSSITKQVTVSATSVTACTNGQAGDLPGFTALCAGPATLYNGGTGTPISSGPWSYSFAFGSPWPGSTFGYTTVFSMSNTQFVSIPFVANTPHVVTFSTNTTYTIPVNSVYSISTSPGLFNGGVANGSTVVCVGKTTPSLSVASDGSSGFACNVNTTGIYWLNMVPGVFAPGGSFTACTKTVCKIAVSPQFGH
jgi:PKD repeat protein